jgi:hypothetical protein
MIVFDRYLFAHMPKTGGTWLSAALRDVGRSRFGDGHGPLSAAHPEWCHGKTMGGTVRDPWSWYASWYHHTLTGGPAQIERVRIIGGGSLEFRDVLRGVTSPGPHCGKHPGQFWRPAYPEVKPYIDSDAGGLWSWGVRWFYGDGVGGWLAAVLLDQAQLRDAASDLVATRLDHAPANVRSERAGQTPMDYRDLYDSDMMGWVLEADGELAATLGYVDPFSPSVLGHTIHLERGTA